MDGTPSPPALKTKGRGNTRREGATFIYTAPEPGNRGNRNFPSKYALPFFTIRATPGGEKGPTIHKSIV